MNSRFLLPLLFIAACTPASQKLSEADSKAVAGEIQTANRGLLDALNAHDIPTVLGYYETGPHFQYVGCTNIIPTSDVFRAIVTGYHKTHPEVTYEMTVTGVEVLDRDNGVATLVGESDSLKLFTTRVWRRAEDGSWKVAYEHESWPGCSQPQLPHPGTTPGDTTLLGMPTGG